MNTKRLLALALVAMCMVSMCLIGTSALAAEVAGTGSATITSANGGAVNVRSKPSISAALAPVGTLPVGTSVTLTARDTDSSGNTWYKIKRNNDVGWVRSDFLKNISFTASGGTTPTNPPSGGGTPTGVSFTAVISGTNVNVRKDSPTGASLGTVSESDGTFTCYRPATPVSSGGHYWVQIKDNSNNKFSGDYGWIAATYVMAGSSMSSARTACSVCGSSLTQTSKVRSFYKNTGNGYHNCDGGPSLPCSINMGKEIREYKCNGTSGHPTAKTVIFQDGIRGCQLTAWVNAK